MAAPRFPAASVLTPALLTLFLPACAVPGRTPVANGPLPSPEPPAVEKVSTVRISPPDAVAGPGSVSSSAEGHQPAELNPLDKILQPWDAAKGTDRPLVGPPDVWDRVQRDLNLGLEDCKNYYSPVNLGALALGIGLAAPLANTPADRSIRNWYQRRVRGETTDEFANVVNYAGQAWVAIPLGLEAAGLLGKAGEDYATDGGWFEWSNRSLRAIAVGSRPMVALYGILGASRPDRNDSRWHPFQDWHGVSGHTFFGAVPFLTAASMTDNRLAQTALVVGSFLTGWSRLDLDRHYFSQAALGWWMAYLAVRTVNGTRETQKGFSFTPELLPDGPGIALELRY
jgi:hypothetical protein